MSNFKPSPFLLVSKVVRISTSTSKRQRLAQSLPTPSGPWQILVFSGPIVQLVKAPDSQQLSSDPTNKSARRLPVDDRRRPASARETRRWPPYSLMRQLSDRFSVYSSNRR